MSHVPAVHKLFLTMKRVVALVLALSASTVLAQGQDPMVGTFSDGFMTIYISGQNGQYSGQFEAGGRAYPFTATGNFQRIDGTYQDAGQLWQFSALLNGDTLGFQNAAQTFQLTRVGAAPPQPVVQTPGVLPAGTRLTYSQAVSSTPAANAGPDARGIAGQGYVEVEIHYLDAAACVVSMTLYTRGMTVNTLTPNGSEYLVTEGSSCADYWRSPAVLASYQAAPGGIESVERGPFQLGGRTYNAISIHTNHQNNRTWRIFDLETGILLSFTEGSGDRSNLDGTSQGASSSAVQELVSIRQVSRPWSSTTPLPAHLQNLNSLSYRGQMVQSTPGITMWDSSTTFEMEMNVSIQQRGAAWLLAQSSTTMSMMGVPLDPVARPIAMNANSGFFLLPSAIPQLQAGQVIDTDPVTGYRFFVERADQNGIVLVTEGAGYRSAATFDAGSGILLSSWSETHEEGTLRTVTMELTGWQ